MLSGLGAVLTLLTAVALVALVLAPPPLARHDDGAPEPMGEAAPPVGPEAPAPRGWPALPPGLVDLAAAPELGWLRALTARLRPEGVTLTDIRLGLGATALGETTELVLDRLRLDPERAGWRLAVAGRLTGEPAVAFAGTGRWRAGEGGSELRLVLDQLGLGELLARLAPERVELADAAATAVVDAELGAGLRVEALDATVKSTRPGRVRLAGMPQALPIDGFEAALAVARGDDSVGIRRFALVSPAFTAAGRGDVGRDRVRLVVGADDVDVAWAPRLWPAGLADGARDWVTRNITAGRIDRLDLRLDLDEQDLTAPVLAPDALAGTARVVGAEIHYLRPMPPVTGADATARFDGERLRFAVTAGAVAGITVTGGEIVLSDYGDPATVERLEVDLTGRGEVPAMLALTDHEPLALASRHDLPVAGTAGGGSFRLRVELPLLEDLALEEVELDFDGRFTGVRLPEMADGRDLTDADFKLDATTESVTANGTGRLAGVPLDLGFEVRGEVERLTAAGRVPAARLSELGAPPLPLTGDVELDAALTTGAGFERTELRLDVTDARVEVPALALWKPDGIAGRIAATIVERADGTTTLDDLAVAWPGAEIAGSARLDGDGRLAALTLDPLTLAGTALTVTGVRADGRLALRVRGPRLDLAPLFDRTGAAPAGRGGPDLAALWPLEVDLIVDEVVAGDDGALTGLEGRIRLDRRGLGHTRLDAGIRPGDGWVNLRLEPGADGARLSLTSTDAGGLARALGLSDAIRGGAVELTGRLTAQRPTPRFEGEIAATDVVVSGAPPVVRVLAAAPATEDLADDDLAVARFGSPVRLAGTVMHLDDALLIASNLAVRAAGEIDLAADRLDIGGSLAPVQGVNRFIGNLPLIGALLQGSKKAGAFALSFTLRGPSGDPSVTVNPLSVVTPGVLQDLFAGAEIRPPQLREDD